MVPSKSAGRRSGVNWMRANCACSVPAMAFTESVLARPGTPSSRTCPLQRRLRINLSTSACWPMTTLPTSVLRAEIHDEFAAIISLNSRVSMILNSG